MPLLMTRKAMLALPLIAATPVIGQDDASAGCAATAAIVADAVEMRSGGADKMKTAETLAQGDVEPKYVEVVAPLVEWVYTLPEHQLTDEAATAFNDACLAQQG